MIFIEDIHAYGVFWQVFRLISTAIQRDYCCSCDKKGAIEFNGISMQVVERALLPAMLVYAKSDPQVGKNLFLHHVFLLVWAGVYLWGLIYQGTEGILLKIDC